jgi:hypothetical protein
VVVEAVHGIVMVDMVDVVEVKDMPDTTFQVLVNREWEIMEEEQMDKVVVEVEEKEQWVKHHPMVVDVVVGLTILQVLDLLNITGNPKEVRVEQTGIMHQTQKHMIMVVTNILVELVVVEEVFVVVFLAI